MVSSEWAAPNTFMPGFDLEKLGILNTGVSSIYGILKSANRLRVSISTRMAAPLEVKFHHNPDSTHGFCGAALSSTSSIGGKTIWANGSGRRSLMGNEPHPDWPILFRGDVGV